MKYIKKEEKTYFNLFEVSKEYNLNISTLRARCRVLKINPICFQGYFQYRLTFKQAYDVVNFRQRQKVDIFNPEIIYVTRTIHHFESKSNFWSENKINEIMLQL